MAVPAQGEALLPQLRLDELLGELQNRLSAVISARDRVHGLLEAVLAVGSDLDLDMVLRRIVEAAVTLVDAEYGALGVIGGQGWLAQFLPVGIGPDLQVQIGALPRGHGLLGVLIDDPRPLRLDDLSTHAAAYGFPPHHPPMKSFLGVPVRIRDEVFGNLYLTEKRGGGGFDEEDQKVVLALASAAGVAIDNARLYDAARRREQWLAASSEVSTGLLSGTPVAEVLRLVARRARALSSAEGALVALPVNGGRLLVEAVDGVPPHAVEGSVLRLDGGTASTVLQAGEAGQVTFQEDGTWQLAVPLGVRGARGVLLVTGDGDGDAPPPTLSAELHAFAAAAALGLELAARRQDAEKLVVLEDRDRIARDLHDLVIQRLFATGMQLESVSRRVSDEAVAARVRRAVDDLDGTIREIRSTIFALQADPGSAPSLRARLLQEVDAESAGLPTAASFRVSGPLDTAVPPAQGDALVAVVREALSNVVRHAAASRVEIEVDAVPEQFVRLLVSDDGVGVPEAVRHSGLRNFHHRAQRFGGRAVIGPRSDGTGTALLWEAPLSDRRASVPDRPVSDE